MIIVYGVIKLMNPFPGFNTVFNKKFVGKLKAPLTKTNNCS